MTRGRYSMPYPSARLIYHKEVERCRSVLCDIEPMSGDGALVRKILTLSVGLGIMLLPNMLSHLAPAMIFWNRCPGSTPAYVTPAWAQPSYSATALA